MTVGIHVPVQNTYDIDALIHGEIEDQVLSIRVNTQPLVQFIPAFPQLGIISQFCADIAQSDDVASGLLNTPGFNGVILNCIDIGSCLWS